MIFTEYGSKLYELVVDTSAKRFTDLAVYFLFIVNVNVSVGLFTSEAAKDHSLTMQRRMISLQSTHRPEEQLRSALPLSKYICDDSVRYIPQSTHGYH